MPIISVRDNENNGLKKNIEKSTQTNTQKRKRTRWTEAIVKSWELSDSVVHLSKVFSS